MDEPWNTDNAWRETEEGEVIDHLPLEAGDDVKKAKWVDINDKIELYASYSQLIQLVAEKRGAHWSEEMYPDFHGWQLGVSCKPKTLK